MSPNRPIEVVCEISSLQEPIQGRLRDEAGRSMEFRGWMDFATALLSIAGGAQNATQPEPLEAPERED